MEMKGVAALLCILAICGAQKWKQETSAWDHEEHRTCSNLTQVLDNWKYAIMTQVKDLLVNNPASVLPEYSRIPPLSDALSDLYKQFNSLKDELGTLTNKFDRVEAFVDDLQAGKLPPRPALAAPQRPVERLPPPVAMRSPLRAQRRAPGRGSSPGGQMVPSARGRRVPHRP